MTRLLVVGAGGIGGIVSAYLNEQGHDVLTLTRNALIADAVNANGFRVRGEDSPGNVKGRAVQKLPEKTAPFDFILLATQPPQVEEAARSVLDFLKPDGAMVCFQNGLCEERIVKIAGVERVIGAIVTWGASMVEPGIYDRTSSGGFQIGRLDRKEDARLEELSQILECVGPTVTTTNLLGARWSKLAINCAISSLGTIGGDRLGVLMRKRHVRRLALEIMTEAVLVARATKVWLEKVSGTLDLDWIALTDAERASAGSASLVAKHALLLAVGARYRRLRSSMLAAIERGRPPAIDFLNGEIVSRGHEASVPTPINAAVRDEVLKIASGKAKSSHDRLRDLYERTRVAVGSAPESVRPPETVPQGPAAAAGPDAAVPSAKPKIFAVTTEALPLPQALTPAPVSPSTADPVTASSPDPAQTVASEGPTKAEEKAAEPPLDGGTTRDAEPFPKLEAALEKGEEPVVAPPPEAELKTTFEDAALTERDAKIPLPIDASATIIGAHRLDDDPEEQGKS